MSNELKHADVICHMARHGFDSVERRLQQVGSEYWVKADKIANPLNCPEYEWRIKPATVTYTVTVPVPMREKPKHGEVYWFHPSCVFIRNTWTDHEVDHERFNDGNCWATEADAQAAFDAIFGPLRSVK